MFKFLAPFLLVGCAGVGGSESFVEAVGELDTDFQENLSNSIFGNALGTVESIAINSDGSKIYVAGSFALSGGTYYLIRLNKDGTVDDTFPYESTFNDSVFSIAVDSDENLWAGGAFTEYQTTVNTGLVKINRTTGAIDSSTLLNLGSGFNESGSDSQITKIRILADGSLLAAGTFNSLAGNTVVGLAKLKANGVPDISFNSNMAVGFSGGSIDSIAEDSDGKLFLSGSFTFFNSLTRNRFVALDSSGVEESDFKEAIGTAFNNGVKTSHVDANGNIWVGGQFDRFNNLPSNPILVLDSSGELEQSYPEGSSSSDAWTGTIRAFAEQANSKIIVGGDLSQVAGTSLIGGGVVRINLSDGTLETEFGESFGTGFSGGSVRILYVDGTSGKIYVGGDFSYFNGKRVPGLIRLK